MQEMFENAVDFLQKKLNGSTHIDEAEKRYRFEHSLRVANIAKKIALKEGQDVFITTMAAILHDAGKYDTDSAKDHGRVSARVARAFLESLNIPEKQVDDIQYCISVHVDGEAGYKYDPIPEAETVSDADNIDRFGVYRIYQSLRWDDIDKLDARGIVEKYTDRIRKLDNYLKKGILSTETANKMFAKNLRMQIRFYKDLIDELNLTNPLLECCPCCP